MYKKTKKIKSRVESEVLWFITDGSEVFLLVAALFVYIRFPDEASKVILDVGGQSVGLSFQFVSSGLEF
jgi:hypothetical protein